MRALVLAFSSRANLRIAPYSRSAKPRVFTLPKT